MVVETLKIRVKGCTLEGVGGYGRTRTYNHSVMAGRVGIEPTQAAQSLKLLVLRPFVLFPQPKAPPLSYVPKLERGVVGTGLLHVSQSHVSEAVLQYRNCVASQPLHYAVGLTIDF